MLQLEQKCPVQNICQVSPSGCERAPRASPVRQQRAARPLGGGPPGRGRMRHGDSNGSACAVSTSSTGHKYSFQTLHSTTALKRDLCQPPAGLSSLSHTPSLSLSPSLPPSLSLSHTPSLSLCVFGTLHLHCSLSTVKLVCLTFLFFSYSSLECRCTVENSFF